MGRSSMIPVVWLTYTEGEDPLDKWDAGLIDRLLCNELWRPARSRLCVYGRASDLSAVGKGAVVVFPAGIHAHKVSRLNSDLSHLEWVLLILTADEQSLLPVQQIQHRNIKIWQMTPRPGASGSSAYIGEGWPRECPTLLADMDEEKDIDVFFAGQTNHQRRQTIANTVEAMPNSKVVRTEGFAQGLDHDTYYRMMARSKVVPCPSGPATPDSFRAFEAMEAGCVPILDGTCPAYDERGYWGLVAPGYPGPIIGDWDDLPDTLATALTDWPNNANHVSAWWQQHKRNLAWRLHDDLTALRVPEPDPTIDDLYTVMVPTSPIPSNPSTAIIEETIGSIRSYLPTAEIIITIDGVRPAQEHRRANYEEFTRRLLWLCEHRWYNVVPVVHSELRHQSGMARQSIRDVHTPLIMYVEHDLPLKGEIPLDQIANVLLSDRVDVIRLYLNNDWEPAHEHMRIDPEPIDLDGLPVKRTWQWSQNPHISTTAYYREILDHRVTDEPRYIEEVMSGVCAGAWTNHGMLGWARHRLAIYAPEGNPARTYHLDGRESDPPFPGA